jgi:hypothetical protein
MKIEIELAENGAILKGEDILEVYEFDEENKDGFINLLYKIKEIFIEDSKYGKEVISINIVHGNKYDCNDKNCKNCKGE